MVVGADGKQIMPGSNPNLPGNKGVFNTIKNAAMGTGDFQKATGFQPAPAAPAAPAPAAGQGAKPAAPQGSIATDTTDPLAANNQPKPAAAPAPAADPNEKRTPAEIQASKDLGSFAGESVLRTEDQMLARIVHLARG
jgi:hypothetical protein